MTCDVFCVGGSWNGLWHGVSSPRWERMQKD